MARPLTKLTPEGLAYRRPKCVEDQIDQALELPISEIRARLSTQDVSNPGYLRSETLVHLLRQAARTDHDALLRVVFAALLSRCERVLLRHIPDYAFRNAAELREEVLGNFAELFARDRSTESFDKLDFFECRFNRAFRAFYLDNSRKRERLDEREVLPSLRDHDGMHLSLTEALDTLAQAYQDQQPRINTDLAAAIASLPETDRQAFVLCEVIGLKQSSNDPDETTAATVAGVSDRTIRSRLNRARARLQEILEEQ